ILLALGVLCWNYGVASMPVPYIFSSFDRIFLFGLTLFCYVTIYLGIAKWILGALRTRGWQVGILLTLILHLVLVAAGTLVPLVIDAMSYSFHSYSLLEVTNPFWTLMATVNQEG